jgi:hypothetical protein
MSVIYGCFFTLCGFCGIVKIMVLMLIRDSPDPIPMLRNVNSAMEKHIAGYQAIEIAGTILGIAGAVALLCAADGILRIKWWARKFALTVCFVTIGSNAIQIGYDLVFVSPAMNSVFDDLRRELPKEEKGALGTMLVTKDVMAGLTTARTLVNIVQAGYLALVARLLLLRDVRATFAGIDAGDTRKVISSTAITEKPGSADRPKDDGRFRL